MLTRTETPSFVDLVDADFLGVLARVIGGSVLGGLIFSRLLSTAGLNLLISRRPTAAALLPGVQV